jgi:hypothetical protein
MLAENRRVYIFLVCLLFMGLTLGTVPTSIPQFLLSGYWLLTGNFKEKFRNFFNQKSFVLWSILWIWHIAGMLWTENSAAGWNDVRIKIPMLLVPLLIGSFKPFEFHEIKWIFYSFLIGLTVNLFWSNFYMWMNCPNDPREASRYMSHIRLGYLIITALLFMIYIFQKERTHKWLYFGVTILCLYSIYNLGILSAVAYAAACFPFLPYYFIKKNHRFKLYVISVAFLSSALFLVYVGKFYLNFFKEKDIPYNKMVNAGGYLHYPEQHLIENGFNAGINIASDELLREWNRRFPENPLSIYNPQFFGLIRYMASLGLTKDSSGFSKLSDSDLSNIMSGISNYKYPALSGIGKKLYDMFYSFRQIYYMKNKSGSSAGMRLYYWQIGLNVIKENWLLGCGTGDVLDEMKKIFVNDYIDPEWMKRPHQQFISIWAALGVAGFILFLIIMFNPVFSGFAKNSIPFFLIWLGFILSFLYEDTLETQTGVSYVVFFYVLLGSYQMKTQN